MSTSIGYCCTNPECATDGEPAREIVRNLRPWAAPILRVFLDVARERGDSFDARVSGGDCWDAIAFAVEHIGRGHIVDVVDEYGDPCEPLPGA